jgi:hypothetical protein
MHACSAMKHVTANTSSMRAHRSLHAYVPPRPTGEDSLQEGRQWLAAQDGRRWQVHVSAAESSRYELLATKSCCRSSNAPVFQPVSIKITSVKTVQNQHEHKIGRIVMIVGICWFIDPEPFGPLHLPPHVIHTILRFFLQPDSLHSQIFRKAGQKKAEPNRS